MGALSASSGRDLPICSPVRAGVRSDAQDGALCLVSWIRDPLNKSAEASEDLFGGLGWAVSRISDSPLGPFLWSGRCGELVLGQCRGGRLVAQ